ncbi:MAG: glycosyltransferase family 9 protein, partial [Fimbriimonadales bacterium]
MHRFAGQPLPHRPSIALMANDALGNFAICTPLAQGLIAQYPGCTLDFYGGERTAELESAGTLFSWRTSVHGTPFSESAVRGAKRRDELGGYDLVVSIEAGHANRALAALLATGETLVCGPCLSPDSRGVWEFPQDERGDLWRDMKWTAEDVADRYTFLETSFIGEMFYKLAYIPPLEDAPWPGGLPRYSFPVEEPPSAMPDVLISTGGTLPEKLWPVEKWRNMLRELGERVGLLGAPPQRQREFYHSDEDEQSLVDEGLAEDLRGKLTLPQVVGALAGADLVITIDNGILHFAVANDVPTVGLY